MGVLLQVALTSSGRVTVLHLRGELDLSTADQLVRELGALPSDVDSVVVLASDLTFLDLTGLDVLLALSRRLRAAGGDLVVRAPSRPVTRLLDLLGGPLPIED